MRILSIALLLFSTPTFAGVPPTSAEQQYQVYKQLPLSNPGFELGKTGYSASGGTFAINTTASNVSTGLRSGSWDASASSQTLSTSLIAIPVGLYGANCLGRIKYKGGDANLILEVTDGTNTLASQTLSAVAGFAEASVSFICPTSGSLLLRLRATADAAIVYVDDLFLGENYKLGTAAQAVLYGSASSAATINCTWSRTGSTSLGSFAADTDCPTPTLSGSATAPGTKIPAVTFPSVPPGEYEVVATGLFAVGSGGNRKCLFELFDGTTSLGKQAFYTSTGFNTGGPVIAGRINYSTAKSNLTFEVRSAPVDNSADTCYLDASQADLQLLVYRYPSSGDTAYKADRIGQVWSGYHANDCAFAVTSGTYADFALDGTCTFTERLNSNFPSVSSTGAKTPGITWTPTKTGIFEICAFPSVLANNTNNAIRLTDGTTVIGEANIRQSAVANDEKTVPICGPYNISSLSAVSLKLQGSSSGTVTIQSTQASTAIEWRITDITQNLPMPVIINSVMSNSPGQERVERATINITGATTCSITSQSGSWLSSCTAAGTVATGVIQSGLFSAAPTCTCSALGSGFNNWCRSNNTAPTATSFTFGAFDTGSVARADTIYVICMGPK